MTITVMKNEIIIAKSSRDICSQQPRKTRLFRISGMNLYILLWWHMRMKQDYRKLIAIFVNQYLKDNNWLEKNLPDEAPEDWLNPKARQWVIRKTAAFCGLCTYKIKHSSKGMTDFDRDEYLRDSFKREVKDELKTRLSNKHCSFISSQS